MPGLLNNDDLDEGADPPDETPLGDDDDYDDDEMVIDDGFLEEEEEEAFVECDPSGRYGRYAEVLGRGAMKTVYRAYDRVDCKEVAWNQAKIVDSQGAVVHREVQLLRSLEKHKGIIKLQADWVDAKKCNINFITELCSATLLEYRRKHKHASRKAVKSWGRQILLGLAHLHSQTPPIIHRDLKCANIFVKSSGNSTLKIGDFGLAATVNESNHRLHSIVGTPEFMAPEMFEEDYDELVDVYAFGMCMLELLTRECPYSECNNVPQIYRKVVSGVKPRALCKVKDAHAVRFINRCLLPACQRPSASDLLSDPFLAPCSDSSALTKYPISQPKIAKLGAFTPTKSDQPVATLVVEVSDRLVDSLRVETISHAQSVRSAAASGALWRETAKECRDPSVGTDEEINIDTSSSCNKTAQRELQRRFQVTGKREDESTVRLKLRIQESCRVRDICSFPFDLQNDSPWSVAEEMVRVLQYPDSDLVTIAELIGAEIETLAGVNAELDTPPLIIHHVSSLPDLTAPEFVAPAPQLPELDITEPPTSAYLGAGTAASLPGRCTKNLAFSASYFKGLHSNNAPIYRSCTDQRDLQPSFTTTHSGVHQHFAGSGILFESSHPQSLPRLPNYSKVFA